MGLCMCKNTDAVPSQQGPKSKQGRKGMMEETMMSMLMSQVMTMQQQQLAKQQQMIRDDPECKELFDKYIALQKQAVDASAKGDSNAMLKAQHDMMELMKHPKLQHMIMPQVANITMNSCGSGSWMGSNGSFGMGTSHIGNKYTFKTSQNRHKFTTHNYNTHTTGGGGGFMGGMMNFPQHNADYSTLDGGFGTSNNNYYSTDYSGGISGGFDSSGFTSTNDW